MSICKSTSDTKTYKIMRLSNGLKALLVMDGDLEADKGKSKSLSVKKRIPDMTDDPAYESCKSLINLRIDTSAACALTVRAGTFHDPDDINGLAHFLEHMLFLGSKKYPDENEFESFLTENGGFSNAITMQECTTFYFVCNTRNLFRALDMFAQFFIAPLFRKDSINRERKAVDSEFQLSLNNDTYRLEHTLASTAVRDNPTRKFMWGNMQTLRDNVSDEKLYRALFDFHKRYYTADRMTLCILSRVPLSTLENCALECFSQIPRAPESALQSEFRLSYPYFEPKKFNRVFYISPLKDISRLVLFWQMPSVVDLYRSKPEDYLAYLFEHEGEGSIFSYLKSKLWVIALQAGIEANGFYSNRLYSLFKVELILTENGYEHSADIVNSIFSYIAFTKLNGPKKKIFEELKQITDLTFKFRDEIPTYTFTINAAENMHYYADRDIICGPYVLYDFKPEAIGALMKYMTPENVSIVVQSRSVRTRVELDRVEPWFKTKYAAHPISETTLNVWRTMRPFSEFHFPDRNKYLPTSLTVFPFSGNESRYPRIIKTTPTSEIWYKRDTSFKLPIAYVNIHLISPIALDSPRNMTMVEFYLNCLQYSMMEKTYPASLAKLNHNEHLTDKGGIVVTLYGFNQKLSVLMETVANSMLIHRNLSNELFSMIKREMTKVLKNSLHYRDVVADELRLTVIQSPYYNISTRCKALAEITKDSFVRFLNRFFERFYIQSLVQGNITKLQAVEMCEKFVSILKIREIPKNSLPLVRIRRLPAGQKTIVLKSFDKSDVNSLIAQYYQWGPVNMSQYTVLELMSTLMEEPLFNQLRTKDQLGYEVNGSLIKNHGVVGLYVTVHWSSSKYNPAYVQNKIRDFIGGFLYSLSNYSVEDFERIKHAAMRNKNYLHDNLEQEVRQNWQEILSEEYMFDRNTRELKQLQAVQLVDVRDALKSFVINGGSKFSQLSILVLGGRAADSIGNITESCELNVIDANDSRRTDSGYYVTNIEAFRDKLPTFPISKIIT